MEKLDPVLKDYVLFPNEAPGDPQLLPTLLRTKPLPEIEVTEKELFRSYLEKVISPLGVTNIYASKGPSWAANCDRRASS